MKVKEVTLTTSPTVVINGDYIKAGASITFTVDSDDDYAESITDATELLKDAYRRSLLAEMQSITAIQKRQTRVRIVKWLKGIINGKEKNDS